MNERIGILGGTFDPIHNGHLYMAEKAAEVLDLSSILLMPSRVPAYKTANGEVSPAKHRANMVQLAVKDREKLAFSGLELKRRGNTYTADTLLEMRKKSPEAEIYFLMGYDSLAWVERWYHSEVIFQNCILVPFLRDDVTEEEMRERIQMLEEDYGARISPVYKTPPCLSSTQVRQHVREGLDISGMVPEAVEKYIMENGLYLRPENTHVTV